MYRISLANWSIWRENKTLVGGGDTGQRTLHDNLAKQDVIFAGTGSCKLQDGERRREERRTSRRWDQERMKQCRFFALCGLWRKPKIRRRFSWENLQVSSKSNAWQPPARRLDSHSAGRILVEEKGGRKSGIAAGLRERRAARRKAEQRNTKRCRLVACRVWKSWFQTTSFCGGRRNKLSAWNLERIVDTSLVVSFVINKNSYIYEIIENSIYWKLSNLSL